MEEAFPCLTGFAASSFTRETAEERMPLTRGSDSALPGLPADATPLETPQKEQQVEMVRDKREEEHRVSIKIPWYIHQKIAH